jgi:hypothetical protein
MKLDNYRERLIALHEAQTKKGIDKYGIIMEQNPGDIRYWLNHFRQEMIDGLNYSFRLEDELIKLGVIEESNIHKIENGLWPKPTKKCKEQNADNEVEKDCDNCKYNNYLADIYPCSCCDGGNCWEGSDVESN